MNEQAALCFTDCPWCGATDEDELNGLDLLGNQLDWMPCCEGMRDAVAYYGWAEVMGVELAQNVQAISGEPPLSIDPYDWMACFRLRVVNPTEHHGGRCESPKGWREQIFSDVDEHHRHHGSPLSYKFGIAVWNGSVRVGVAVVGRPVSRLIQQAEPRTLEVTRVTCWGDARLRRNASSKLYGACARTARIAGADKLITYTLETENGSSLKASGFTAVATSRGGSWSRPARRRTDSAPTCPKTRWERRL